MLKSLSAMVVSILLLSAVRASADPIFFTLSFRVDTAYNPYTGTFTSDGVEIFTTQPGAGRVYSATVGFDDGWLASDGSFTGVGLNSFRLEIAGLVWDPYDAESAFFGFRGPDLGAISPVLIIAGGGLVGMGGGVYGAGDANFVDFWNDGTFSAKDAAGNFIMGKILSNGPLASVPEPASICFMMLGLAGIGTISRFRKKPPKRLLK